MWRRGQGHRLHRRPCGDQEDTHSPEGKGPNRYCRSVAAKQGAPSSQLIRLNRQNPIHSRGCCPGTSDGVSVCLLVGNGWKFDRESEEFQVMVQNSARFRGHSGANSRPATVNLPVDFGKKGVYTPYTPVYWLRSKSRLPVDVRATF